MNINSLLLVFAVLFSLSSTYETDADVLVLTDQDFPQVIHNHPYILVEFYAPWCGHCQQLAPIYLQVAAALKESGSQIKLAKVDADIHQKMAQEYSVEGFPTLFFFVNGTKIDFKGSRTKQGIISWLNKKILPATNQISAIDSFKVLQNGSSVSIVLFSNDQSKIQDFKHLAMADDYNKYYIATQNLLSQQSLGTVKLIRNFDQQATFSGDFSGLSRWIQKNSRPSILHFDKRTIKSMFEDAKKAVVFINPGIEDSTLRLSLVSESKANDGDLIFVQIDKKSEHFERFADHIKVKTNRPRIVIIDAVRQKKFVLVGPLSEESIINFLKSYKAGEAKQYDLTTLVQDNDENVTPEQEL